MWCEIDHEIELTAGKRASVPALMLRLCPRPCLAQRSFGFQLLTNPTGRNVEEFQDAEGNAVCVLVVPEHVRQVRVRARSHVEFSTIPSRLEGAYRAELPLDYGVQTRPLFAYLTRDAPAIVECLARQVIDDSDRTVVAFLKGISALLAQHVKLGSWSGIFPCAAQEVWSRRRGNALDLAMLYVEICRAAGLAARLVQGYRLAHRDEPPNWHAWAEIYLPDGGWIARDPGSSRDGGTMEAYVPVAASFHPAHTLPVGSASGNSVAYEYRTTHLSITSSDTPMPALHSYAL